MIEFVKNLFKKSENHKERANGKRTVASDELILNIWKNQENVPIFCEKYNVSRSKYYRIRSWEKYVLNEADRERFKKLEKML